MWCIVITPAGDGKVRWTLSMPNPIGYGVCADYETALQAAMTLCRRTADGAWRPVLAQSTRVAGGRHVVYQLERQ